MEILKVAEDIERTIGQLKAGRLQLGPRAQNRAETIGRYEKNLGITMMKLRNGVKFVLDNVEVFDPPATCIEKIARAICFQEKIDMELADTQYKNASKGLDCLRAELNGYQSINRHLD